MSTLPTKAGKPAVTQARTKRQPVIAVMGHIDHGKSTLLDYIRRTNVVAKEAGGITQHIAAYEVVHSSGNTITFLDTPGHAAFKGIRVRGANVADIAILVVSAEEGVKPQTSEALQHIKASGIPYVVAINKIDSPKANVERTKQSLAENEIYIEGYGGDVPALPISAKTGEGINDLLDTLLLVADMQNLTYGADKSAEGIIIEANLDPKKGISATLILKDGVLNRGQAVVCGQAWAPVRIMENFAGKPIESAKAGMPVRLVGFSTLPPIGELFFTCDDKKQAEVLVSEHIRSAAAEAEAKAKRARSTAGGATGAAGVAGEEQEIITIPLVVKADVSGTLEAIVHELSKLEAKNPTGGKVRAQIISSGIGEITEVDVKMVSGLAHIAIVAFNVKTTATARNYAERAHIPVYDFNIIYKLIEWVEAQLISLKPKVLVEKVTGSAKILKVFSKEKDRQIVGGRVTDGLVIAGANVNIMRRGAKIGEGKIRELQQQKQKASEAKMDTEFGTMIESRTEIAVGDMIDIVEMVEE
jgi:translation initiation factor IF-2